MGKPAIVAVDDDPQVLAAVGRDLRRRYADGYRVIGAGSGAEALEALSELDGRDEVVALLLVDQRMPEMSGTEFLIEARRRYPDAKRLLLTAYADTDAAIQAINEVALDHYLLKPWDPPEDNLYPVLDDVLDDWQANVPAPFDGVRVAGTTWSPATYEVKDFLARNQIPYRFIDVERDPDAASRASAAGGGTGTLPVVYLSEGDPLVGPDKETLARSLGLRVDAGSPFYDLVIIGGGPAGLAGAVYGASEGLRTLMVERQAPGGQAGTSSRIENYLGFPSGIAGADLARRASTQASRLGAELLTPVEVESVAVHDSVKEIELSNDAVVQSHAVLIATGMTVRRLNVPGYQRFEGAGVYYGAAASEAASYQGKEVYVIGGANSAGQAAMMFSRFASTVNMIVRAESLSLRMSQYLINQIEERDNITVTTGCEVVEVTGEERVEAIRLRHKAGGEEETRPASALFIFVGAVPHSGFVADVVAMNEQGFIYTGRDIFLDGKPATWTVDRDPFLLETSVPGIFAAGDVRHGVVRRVASAVGQGSIAVSMIHKYLETV